MNQTSRSGATASWLVPSIAAILAVFVGFWLPKMFSEKPDLRFSVTSPISTKMLDTARTAYIQEVAVSNIGNAAAKDVVLTCENGVIEYELYRAAETDKVQEYFNNTRLEIRYFDLPPGGTFKVILKSNAALSSYNIGLKHSQGVGKDIFAKANPFKGMLSGSVLFVLYLIGWGWFTWKDTGIEWDCTFNPKRVLSRTKPWHMRTRKWRQCISSSIDKCFSNDAWRYSLANLQENVGYKYLAGEFDTFNIYGEEKDKADKAAIDNFKAAAIHAMNNARGKDEAYKIVEIIVALDNNDYSDIRFAISKAWVSNMIDLMSMSDSLSIGYIASLMSKKPDGILNDHWEKYVLALERIIIKNMNYWIRTDKTFESICETEHFTTLSDDVKQMIKESIYESKMTKVPKNFMGIAEARDFLDNYDLGWMTEKDSIRCRNTAEDTIALYENKEKYEKLFTLLTSLLKYGALIDELDTYGDLAEPIKKLEADIAIAREQNSREASRLEELQLYLRDARVKVDRQMEIISIALSGDMEHFKGLEYPEEVFGQVNIVRIREAIFRIASVEGKVDVH